MWVDAVHDLGRHVDRRTEVAERGPNPASGHTFASRGDLPRARFTTSTPPWLSELFAATTTTASGRPRVSTIPYVLRPEIFLRASYPLIEPVTVDAPRALRASITVSDGSRSRLLCSLSSWRDRSAMHFVSRDARSHRRAISPRWALTTAGPAPSSCYAGASTRSEDTGRTHASSSARCPSGMSNAPVTRTGPSPTGPPSPPSTATN